VARKNTSPTIKSPQVTNDDLWGVWTGRSVMAVGKDIINSKFHVPKAYQRKQDDNKTPTKAPQ